MTKEAQQFDFLVSCAHCEGKSLQRSGPHALCLTCWARSSSKTLHKSFWDENVTLEDVARSWSCRPVKSLFQKDLCPCCASGLHKTVGSHEVCGYCGYRGPRATDQFTALEMWHFRGGIPGMAPLSFSGVTSAPVMPTQTLAPSCPAIKLAWDPKNELGAWKAKGGFDHPPKAVLERIRYIDWYFREMAEPDANEDPFSNAYWRHRMDEYHRMINAIPLRMRKKGTTEAQERSEIEAYFIPLSTRPRRNHHNVLDGQNNQSRGPRFSWFRLKVAKSSQSRASCAIK